MQGHDVGAENLGNIVLRFLGNLLSLGPKPRLQPGVHVARPPVVGRKGKARVVVVLGQLLLEVGNAALDVLGRVVGVHAQTLGCVRHELHQPARPGFGNGPGISGAFRAHDRPHQVNIDPLGLSLAHDMGIDFRRKRGALDAPHGFSRVREHVLFFLKAPHGSVELLAQLVNLLVHIGAARPAFLAVHDLKALPGEQAQVRFLAFQGLHLFRIGNVPVVENLHGLHTGGFQNGLLVKLVLLVTVGHGAPHAGLPESRGHAVNAFHEKGIAAPFFIQDVVLFLMKGGKVLFRRPGVNALAGLPVVALKVPHGVFVGNLVGQQVGGVFHALTLNGNGGHGIAEPVQAPGKLLQPLPKVFLAGRHEGRRAAVLRGPPGVGRGNGLSALVWYDDRHSFTRLVPDRA